MEEITLSSWNEYASKIEELRTRFGTITHQLDENRIDRTSNDLLFRGQSDANWPLETTLERKTKDVLDVTQYIQVVDHCVNELESFSGKKWHLKTFPELRTEISDRQQNWRPHLPCYEYLVYLRHHGFPSPLMDWSTSPYIAAYFAYCDAINSENVAVYLYVPTTTGSRGGWANDPAIHVQGPYATTHPRHFVQKAWYTIATQWCENDKSHRFCSHANIFKQNNDQQDVLIKIVLPTSEREKALRSLDDSNINHFTLFQTEDALVKAMAMKAFDMEDKSLGIQSRQPSKDDTLSGPE